MQGDFKRGLALCAGAISFIVGTYAGISSIDSAATSWMKSKIDQHNAAMQVPVDGEVAVVEKPVIDKKESKSTFGFTFSK